jgi:arsenical pump membrane protein
VPRGIPERPFVYGTVCMSNSASLLLPGSNLTNLIVAGTATVPALNFARAMLLPWLAVVVITTAATWCLHRRELRVASGSWSGIAYVRGSTGFAAIVAATVLILLLPNPALPVLVLGAVLTGCQGWQNRESLRALLRSVPWELAALFTAAVTLGAVARLAPLPPAMLHADAGSSVVEGTLAAAVLNNLPAGR